jgi:hypothetical protein
MFLTKIGQVIRIPSPLGGEGQGEGCLKCIVVEAPACLGFLKSRATIDRAPTRNSTVILKKVFAGFAYPVLRQRAVSFQSQAIQSCHLKRFHA